MGDLPVFPTPRRPMPQFPVTFIRHRAESGRKAVNLPFSVLGLQAAVADGSELTFDGHPMQVGTHLRWSFVPELGPPPGEFWLARRVASRDRGGQMGPPA